jgi:hypothetical protein
MARTTARDLITDAALTAGIVGATESLEAQETSHALNELNNILESWDLDELFPYTKTISTLTLAAGESSFTMGQGVGADIDTRRPNRIKSVAVLIGTTFFPLRFVQVDSYDNSAKITSSGGIPQFYTVRTDFPDITIELYPNTSGPYDIEVTSEVSLAPVTLNDNIALPVGYYPALQYKLAEDLCLHYGIPEKYAVVAKKATEFMSRVQRINNIAPELSMRGAPTRSFNYDINSDSYSGRF